MSRKSAAQLDSEIAVARMIGRRVKSGWHGLADGVIVKWDPFGAAGTDVLVRDVASGKEAWFASHGLTPIDGKGPLPSRAEVRKLRQRETEEALETIRAQHIADWRRPWPGAEHGKAILGRAIDTALEGVRKSSARQGKGTRSHAITRASSSDWTARQMASGRRVVEKTRGDKTARIFQGEGYWTVTLSRPSIGEVARQSARTLAAAKTLGTKLLKAR